MSYDRIDWHSHGENFPDAAKSEQGGTHIGMFLTWIIDNNLIGELYIELASESIEMVKNREMTGRAFLIENCDSKFYDEMVNEEGKRFVEYYYEKEGDGNYFGDYVDTFDDYENVYDVKNSWENYDKIRPVIDKRYQDWKNNIM